MKYIQLFGMLYVVVIGLIYALNRGHGIPKLLPGDIYFQKAGRGIYIPLGASLIITSILFLILFSMLK